MQKKFIIIILISLIIIILGIGILNNNDFNNQKIKVGDAYFTLPEGYHEGKLNDLGHINITDNSHSIFISNISGANITNYVNQYVDNLSETNQNVTLSNFTINGILVYKSMNLETGANHYWFVKDGKMYTIYNWEKNNDMDDICIDLIRSMKS